MSEKPNYLAMISNKGFRVLWANQILVQLSSNTLNFALIIWVYKLVNSNFAVSLLLVAVYLPAILFGLFAGVFVDITDRKKVIAIIDILLSLAFFAFILIKGSFILILLNTFLINTLAQFFIPAESSSIPMLVSRKQLFFANSLFSLTLYGAFMIGYSIGGPILNIFGIDTIFMLGGGLLAIAFLLVQYLPSIKSTCISKKFDHSLSVKNLKNMWKVTGEEAKSTFRFIKGKLNIAVAIALLSAIQGIVGVLAVVMPDYVERVLRIHATDASYFVMLPLGLGMVTGAFLVGRLFYNRPKRFVVIPAMIGAGIIFILIGLVPTLANILHFPELPLYLTQPRYFFRAPSVSFWFASAAFIIGLFTVSIIVPCQTILQENTTERNRGKIFAVLSVVMTGFAAIPVLLAGSLADIFGATSILMGVGTAIFIIGLLARFPSFFFQEHHLPRRVRGFLGLGHWEKGTSFWARKNI